MAQKDFCFYYYDGDAARDKAHMSRLERGAYDDIISMQRKFGHLAFERIKKSLGEDFETCWDSIELILIKDEDGKYFIQWVQDSLDKSAAFSKKQSENGKQGGRGNQKEKPDESQTEANTKAKSKPEHSQKKPLEDGYEYGNENEKEFEVGVGGAGGNSSVAKVLDLELEAKIDEVLNYFVTVTGSEVLLSTKSHRQFIRGRLKEKIPVDILKKIIDMKQFQWRDPAKNGGKDMRPFIRISTLFNSEKCNEYVVEVKRLESNPELKKEFIEKYGDGQSDTNFASEWNRHRAGSA